MLVAAGMVLMLAAYLSLFPALCFFWVRKLTGLTCHHQILGLVVLWVLFEWIRSWFMTGFPWLSYGHALVNSPLRGVLPVGGTFAGSALIALCAGLIAKTILEPDTRPRKQYFLIASLLISCWGLDFINWTHVAAAQPLKVAAVQSNIPEAMKWKRSLRGEIYQRHADASADYLEHDVVVWPETAIPTFYRVAEQEFISQYAHQLAAHKAEVIAGVFTHQPSTDEIYNSVAVSYTHLTLPTKA